MRNTSERKEMLAERRIKQRNLTAGFTPVYNSRINPAIEARYAVLVGMGRLPHDAMPQAHRDIARTLPMPPIGYKSHRIRPSKNDSAEYRRGNRV